MKGVQTHTYLLRRQPSGDTDRSGDQVFGGRFRSVLSERKQQSKQVVKSRHRQRQRIQSGNPHIYVCCFIWFSGWPASCAKGAWVPGGRAGKEVVSDKHIKQAERYNEDVYYTSNSICTHTCDRQNFRTYPCQMVSNLWWQYNYVTPVDNQDVMSVDNQ